MRFAWTLVTAVVLVLALGGGGARADVFVPADPPSRPTSCAAAAGDVVAGARGRTAVATSVAGGPWRRMPALSGCPVVAAAPDGTAAIVAYAEKGMRMVVRHPGGAFGRVIALGGSLTPPAVAVAPGGWALVAWAQDGRRPGASTLTVVVVGPDGSARRSVLDRVGVRGRPAARISPPRAAIGASGRATVVWSRSTLSRVRWRVAHSAGGGPWAAGADLPAGAGLLAGGPVVAAAPGGLTLIAWPAADGVRAAIDGAATATVAAVKDARALTAAVNDAGAAVIAIADSSGTIVAVDRAPFGAWTAAHPLSGDGPPGEPPPEGAFIGTEESGDVPLLLSALTPDGRAAVSWPVAPGNELRIVASSGRAGGSWSRAAPVSAATLLATSSTLALDAGGEPRLLWAESDRDAPNGRLRGARPVDDALAPPPDATAPVPAARWPADPPPTRTGRLSFAVPVICSEACDARLRLIDQRDDFEPARIVATLDPGRETTLRLAVSPAYARDLLARPGARRFRLELVVSDRAGNVTTAVHPVRVRVVKVPLRAFKVPARHDFAMFTSAGNRAVARFVNRLIEGLASRSIRNVRELVRRYGDGIEAIERAGHGEISDTAVGDAISEALDAPLIRSGYDPEVLLSW